MSMQQRMDVRQEQKLVMTPQLQLAIKLLQMPTLDLKDFVAQELTDNPFLQNNDGTGETAGSDQDSGENMDSLSALEKDDFAEKDLALDVGWDNMYDTGRGAGGSSYSPGDEDGPSWEQTASEDISLKDHLDTQLGEMTDDHTLQFLGSYLIDSVDDSGYIRLDLNDVATRLSVPLKKLEEALALIQVMEPAGIGARTLEECLSLQIEQDDIPRAYKTAAKKVVNNLNHLARQDYKKLAKLADCSEEEIHDICDLIKNYTPKPGLKYGTENATTVIPDVVISKDEHGEWKSELNADALPKILVNQNYAQTMNKSKSEEKTYMNERVGRAQWLIKSLEQRARTIFKVSNAIVEFQKDFFNYGAENLQPMTLKIIADAVEVHESTVSRVTNGKYMQTPMGVFELKYFFSSAIGTTGGNTSVASESVKQMIKRLLGEESPAKPLSDEKLVQLLKQEGVDVARRTVAKYREALGIASSSGRRVRA